MFWPRVHRKILSNSRSSSEYIAPLGQSQTQLHMENLVLRTGTGFELHSELQRRTWFHVSKGLTESTQLLG